MLELGESVEVAGQVATVLNTNAGFSARGQILAKVGLASGEDGQSGWNGGLDARLKHQKRIQSSLLVDLLKFPGMGVGLPKKTLRLFSQRRGGLCLDQTKGQKVMSRQETFIELPPTDPGECLVSTAPRPVLHLRLGLLPAG